MKNYTPHPREQAMELIETYIRDSGMKAGDKLPPEREMCEMWGVNRSTLRSALARMNASGRFTSLWGSGTRLAPRIDRTLQDLKSFSEYAWAQGMEPESRLLGFSNASCDKALARRFGMPVGEQLYRIARLRLLDKMPLMLETAFIPARLAPRLEEHDLVEGSLFAVLADCYGLSPDHGWEKLSITFATVEEAANLNIEEGAPAFWIVSETYDAEDQLIEYCRTVGRADRITMSSTLLWK